MRMRRLAAALLMLAAFLTGCAVVATAQSVPTNVPAGIHISKDLGRADLTAQVNITVHMKLPDQAAFEQSVDALYDPASPTYHKWMINADLAKFAPPEAQREAVRQELRSNGLTIMSTDPLGFTIRARGAIADVERAFNTKLHQFQYKGSTYRANVQHAQLSGPAGEYVSTVAGLESHQVKPLAKRAFDYRTGKPFPTIRISRSNLAPGFPPVSTTNCLYPPVGFTIIESSTFFANYHGTLYASDSIPSTKYCDYLPSEMQHVYGLDTAFANGLKGWGQTIVLVEAYGYPTLESDANFFFTLAGLPLLNPSNFKIIYPQGPPPYPGAGILTGWNTEMAMDLQWAHSIAPGAKIAVVAASGQDSEDFQDAILYVAANNVGTSVSNSYEEDLDLISGVLEQTSWDQTLMVAAAKGIAVNFSSGDDGDEGLGTPVGAAMVPSIAPHATSIGGTSILNDVSNPGSTITTAWGDTVNYLFYYGYLYDPPTELSFWGGGGGGESIFWPKPTWQKMLPGTGRQGPDISALADPYTGVPIMITNGSNLELQYGWGGTSLACPIFTAMWAIATEKAGHRLGQPAPMLSWLPHKAILDVLPTTDSSPNNVVGTITDNSGPHNYSASDLFHNKLYGNVGFTSAFWALPYGDNLLFDFGFGLDSSLTTAPGWDNATGWGTPNGFQFILAASQLP